ncbi:MAG: family 10 glycosylhydrolase [Flaviaesturariibacter sp.]|nr:family 10 glycosylhydrolase [Flaviaesturariibacter sp.]
MSNDMTRTHFNILLCTLALSTFLASCRPPRAATTKAMGGLSSIVIEPRSAWQAAEPRPYKSQTPVRITIHHEGTRLELTADAAAKIHAIQKWGMGLDRNWADIPYHFLIAPNGTIYEGRNVMTAGETATEYDPSGHLLITCLGNLEVQELPAAQLASLVRLTAWCSRKYKIPLSTLSGHRDNSSQTTSPGKNLYAYLQNGYIRREAEALLVQQ